MTILGVVQKAATKIGIAVPTVLFAGTTRTHLELQAIVNECAEEITDAHDWQKLKAIATFTGTGSADAFDLPADYDRMLKTASLWTSRYSWSMNHVLDSDLWLELVTLPYTQMAGSWTIYGGQVHILDTMVLDDTAKFFYIKNTRVDPASGDNKATFTADDDAFVLSEELLRRSLIWKWKEAHGQPYDEPMADYNVKLASEIDKDGGSKPIVSGQPATSWRTPNVAWPGTISPVA